MSEKICPQGHVVEESRDTCSRCNAVVANPVAEQATVATPKVKKADKAIVNKPVKAKVNKPKIVKVTKKTKSKK